MLFLLAFAAFPFGTEAQQAWGDEGGCARVAGKDVYTDRVLILWPDRIEHHESTCMITSVEGDINTRAVINTKCEGEGETWVQSYGATPTGGGAFAIWSVDAPDQITALRVCE